MAESRSFVYTPRRPLASPEDSSYQLKRPFHPEYKSRPVKPRHPSSYPAAPWLLATCEADLPLWARVPSPRLNFASERWGR